MLRRHYEELGKVSVDDNFEADWKEEVVSTLETCSILSEVSENVRLDRQIDREEIAQCVKKLKNNKTGGCVWQFRNSVFTRAAVYCYLA